MKVASNWVIEFYSNTRRGHAKKSFLFKISAQKIHISEATESALQKLGGFQTELRAEIEIKVSTLNGTSVIL